MEWKVEIDFCTLCHRNGCDGVKGLQRYNCVRGMEAGPSTIASQFQLSRDDLVCQTCYLLHSWPRASWLVGPACLLTFSDPRLSQLSYKGKKLVRKMGLEGYACGSVSNFHCTSVET